MKINKIFVLIISMLISFNVYSDCSLRRASTLRFGVYNPLSQTEETSNSKIIVICKSNINYAVKLTAGNSNNYQRRFLSSKNEKLFYNIFLNNAYQVIWGDGSNNTGFYSGKKRGRTRINVFGYIPSKQNISKGYYTDTIIVTLEY